jgi:outer membrane protein assembly factor BamB
MAIASTGDLLTGLPGMEDLPLERPSGAPPWPDQVVEISGVPATSVHFMARAYSQAGAQGELLARGAVLVDVQPELEAGASPTAVDLVLGDPWPEADAAWPRWRGTPDATGASPFTGPSTNALKWQYDHNGDVLGSVLIGADGTVYGLSSEGDVLALDPDTGAVLWECDLRVPIGMRVLTPEGLLCGSLPDGGLLAVDTATGAVAWRSAPGPDTRWLALSGDGMTLYGGHPTELRAYDAITGALLWSLDTPRDPSYCAIDHVGNLYLGAGSTLLSVDPAGTERWTLSLPDTVKTTTYGRSAETVYVGCEDGTVHAVDAGTGIESWSRTLGLKVRPAIGVGSDGTIYAGSGDGIHALAQDGSTKWSYGTDEAYYQHLTIDGGGNVYVPFAPASSDSDLVILSLDSAGSERWRRVITDDYPSKPGETAIGPDGTLFVGGGSWSIYAIGPGG